MTEEFSTATISFKDLESKAATVIRDIEIVLTDASVIEDVLPPQVRAVLVEARTILGIIEKILGDI